MVSQFQSNHFSQQKDHQELWFHSCNLTTSLNKKTIKSYGFTASIQSVLSTKRPLRAMVSQFQSNHFSQQTDHQELWFHSRNLTTSLNKKTIKSYGFTASIQSVLSTKRPLRAMVSQFQSNHFSQQKDHQELWFHSCSLTTSLNKKTIKSYGFTAAI